MQGYLDDHLNIRSTECECLMGEFRCSHVAAMFIYGLHNLSRTGGECQWQCKRSVEPVQAASQMFPLPERRKDYSLLSRVLSFYLFNRSVGFQKLQNTSQLHGEKRARVQHQIEVMTYLP